MTDDAYRVTLAKNLCRIHGDGRLSSGKSGAILYLPCPKCLKKYGRRELKSQHLAVRLDEMAKSMHRGDDAWVATCMKAGCGFKGKYLLELPPISVRIPGSSTDLFFDKSKTVNHPRMVDHLGKSVPFPPGEVIPLPALPANHPAVEYLAHRGFDIHQLWDKYLTSYCTKELEPTRENGLHYRNLVGNWRSTPQGRIVFFAKYKGSITGWQSRLIDKVEGRRKYTLSPDCTWEHTETLNGEEWQYEPQYANAEENHLWPPPKYRNAIGQINGEAIFGYDHMVPHLEQLPFSERYVVVTEGPLDAVRFGPFGIPLLGKSIQKEMLDQFQKVTPTIVVASDNDTPGKAAATKIMKMVETYGLEVIRIQPPPCNKDFGELTNEHATRILQLKLDGEKGKIQ